MRRSVPLLAAVLLVAMVLPCTSSSAAFEEMSGIVISISPGEATSGGDLDMAVTVANHNNRSLTVTVITVQIYNGNSVWTNENQQYHADLGDGLVPANGSREFGVSSRAPNYVGGCSVSVVIAGIFDGDANASVGGMSTYMTLNPNVGGFVTMGLLIILVPLIALVVVAVVAIYFFGRRSVPDQAYSRRCDRCGEFMPPGSSYCKRCGKRN